MATRQKIHPRYLKSFSFYGRNATTQKADPVADDDAVGLSYFKGLTPKTVGSS